MTHPMSGCGSYAVDEPHPGANLCGDGNTRCDRCRELDLQAERIDELEWKRKTEARAYADRLEELDAATDEIEKNDQRNAAVIAERDELRAVVDATREDLRRTSRHCCTGERGCRVCGPIRAVLERLEAAEAAKGGE